MRIISAVKGGMHMSERMWSRLYVDDVDYDLMIGAKWDKGGTFLSHGFAGYIY